MRVELNEVHILLELIRRKHLATVLAEASIHDEDGVRAVPLDIPDNDMQGCVHTLRDTYHKHSMQQFIKLLNDSAAIKRRINSWL